MAVLGALDDTVWVLDEKAHLVYASLGRPFPLAPPEVGASVGVWLIEHLYRPDRDAHAEFSTLAALLPLESSIEREVRLHGSNGAAHWVRLRIAPISAARNPSQWLFLLREISGQRRVEHELRLAATVFENSLEGILITGANGLIAQVNHAFTEITGYAPTDALGRKPSFLRSGTEHEPGFQAIQEKLAAGGHWQGELLNRRKDGQLFPAWVSISGVRGDDSTLAGMITTFRDISESKTNEERIRRLAYYDALTGLPNRSLFADRLTQALQRAQRASSWLALLFLDLDGFKEINDSMGHGVGDLLLKQVADRLGRCVRAQDTVARMGGDEFTVVLADEPNRTRATAAAAHVAAKVKSVLGEPFLLMGRETFISTSIGIALYPGDGEESSTLLRNADTAMYQAKEGGKNAYVFYKEAMSARTAQRLDLQSAMHRAVLDEQFEVLFQPQVSLRNQAITGAECLLRWAHPTRGRISPADFVPIAEQSGLIVPIGRWVLEKACQQLAVWRATGVELARIAVNLSARQFIDGELVGLIARILAENGLEPAALELELTESILMDDVGRTLAVLGRLKEMGVRIAIDDFGTGYSSLNYLTQFPLDCLKIDRTFVQQLGPVAPDHRIASAIVALARSFELDVSAEGIETADQLVALQELGCDQGQGYLFGAPLHATEFGERWRAAQPQLPLGS